MKKLSLSESQIIDMVNKLVSHESPPYDSLDPRYERSPWTKFGFYSTKEGKWVWLNTEVIRKTVCRGDIRKALAEYE